VTRALPLLSPLRGKTRNEYWRARVMQATLQPVEPRVSLLLSTLTDFTREPEHRFFPRAHAEILESLGSARMNLGQRADACGSLASALTLRSAMDGASATTTRRLSIEHASNCAEFAAK
jgi:hypothetical protein